MGVSTHKRKFLGFGHVSMKFILGNFKKKLLQNNLDIFLFKIKIKNFK